MTDQNLTEFYTRVARIEKMRALGYGFEAAGTLGRPVRAPQRGRWMPVVRSALLVVGCAIGLKAAMHYAVGSDVYDARVARLEAGDSMEKLGGILMTADPATVWLADQLRAHLPTQD